MELVSPGGPWYPTSHNHNDWCFQLPSFPVGLLRRLESMDDLVEPFPGNYGLDIGIRC